MAGDSRDPRRCPRARRGGVRRRRQQQHHHVRLGRRQHDVGSSSGKTFPDFNIAYDTGIDFLDPGLSYTVQGWEIMWNVYLPLLGYKHVNGPDGATLVPYLAQDMPTVSADGKTYTLHAAQGAEVLGRHADQGERLRRDDRARLQDRLAGRRLLREHRRRRHVQQDEEGPHQRDHDGRRDGQDHDQAQRAAGRLQVHPRDRVRGARAGELAAEGHLDEPASVDGPVHDLELQAEQVGDRRPQPELRRERLRRQRAERATRTR